jgi:transcriptional regulator with XRE-family HTH domain
VEHNWLTILYVLLNCVDWTETGEIELGKTGRKRVAVESYGTLLARYRETRGMSQRALARAMNLNPTLINRSEAGDRAPAGPDEIAGAARALQLTADEHDVLLESAGYWPSAFLSLGSSDPTLRVVATTLADPSLTPEIREEFRRAIDSIARLAASKRAIPG